MVFAERCMIDANDKCFELSRLAHVNSQHNSIFIYEVHACTEQFNSDIELSPLNSFRLTSQWFRLPKCRNTISTRIWMKTHFYLFIETIWCCRIVRLSFFSRKTCSILTKSGQRTSYLQIKAAETAAYGDAKGKWSRRTKI